MWTCPNCDKTFKRQGYHLPRCDPYLDVVAFTEKQPRGDDEDCWLFMGARVPAGGYGRAWINKRLVAAHRIAYMLAYGNIPAGLDVMHLCDNPPCVNPRHLKAATTAENMADCKAKGRSARAGKKLDDRRAREILNLKGVVRAVDAAERYDVTLSTVHGIWTGKNWKHIQGAA